MHLMARKNYLFGQKKVSVLFTFWSKTHPVLGKNASRFGPKRDVFWAKMGCVLVTISGP